MGDELERLRDLVRALAAERRAWETWHTAMDDRLERCADPTEDSIREMMALSAAHTECQRATDRALDRVREIAPGLFAEPGAAADRAGGK